MRKFYYNTPIQYYIKGDKIMSSKFRTFLMTLTLIPCLFIFAGCTPVAQLDQNVSIDTRGNYQNSSAETTWDILKDINYSNIDLEDGNVRLNFSFTCSIPDTDDISGTVSFILRNIKVNNDETIVINAIRTKINTTVNNQPKQDIITEYHIFETSSSQDTEKHYIDYSFALPDDKYETVKYDVSETGTMFDEKVQLYQEYWQLPIMTVDDLILPSNGSTPESGHLWTTPNAEYKLSNQSNITKIRVTTPDGHLFIVSQDNKFYGLQATNLKLSADGIVVTLTGGMEVFQQDVELPDFSEYNQYTPPVK